MKDLTKKKKINPAFYIKYFKIIIIVLVVVLLVLGYFFLVGPEYKEYKSGQSSITVDIDKIDNQMEKLSKLNKIIKDYENISLSDKEKVHNMLPTGIDKSSLYVNIESIAKEVNLSLNDLSIRAVDASGRNKKASVNTSSTAGQNELQKVAVEISLSEVNYLNLKQLIGVLETNLRLFDIQSFNFSPESGDASISLIGYYLYL